MQIADVDERDVAIEPERTHDRPLRVLRIEPVDLVERNFDCKRAVAIDSRGAAVTLVALKHEHPVPGAGIERRRDQATKTGPDRNCVELAAQAQTFTLTMFPIAGTAAVA